MRLEFYPFIGILLSIALGPLLFKQSWHHKQIYFLVFFCITGLYVIFNSFSFLHGIEEIIHVMSGEFLPFIIMILTLYIISSGLVIDISLNAKPWHNVIFLTTGALLANIIGTTGAAMLLIRPFLQINDYRQSQAHNVVFFIFLVANIGGCLTPLGDPPLFLGFLSGVPFFWCTTNLWSSFVLTFIPLIIIYWSLDHYFYSRDKLIYKPEIFVLRIHGKKNIVFLLIAVFLVFSSHSYGHEYSLQWMGADLTIANIINNLCLLVIATVTYKISHKKISLEPIKEIALVFSVIFITMIPVISYLKENSAVFSVVNLNNPFNLFWLVGTLSAFLDNAPTYLLFFNIVGGDADLLINSKKLLLQAISAGAVYMGAITYIGNAPNFMVRSIAQTHGIKMPSFFGYILWSSAILLPILLLVSWLLW